MALYELHDIICKLITEKCDTKELLHFILKNHELRNVFFKQYVIEESDSFIIIKSGNYHYKYDYNTEQIVPVGLKKVTIRQWVEKK